MLGWLLTAVAVALLTAGIVALAWFPSRRLAARMIALDAELRPGEQLAGKCGACEGLGTLIEHYRNGPARVICYRCGGSGDPPPPVAPGEVPTIHSGGAWGPIARDVRFRRRR